MLKIISKNFYVKNLISKINACCKTFFSIFTFFYILKLFVCLVGIVRYGNTKSYKNKDETRKGARAQISPEVNVTSLKEG